MIRYCAVIFGCLVLGELLIFLTKIQFPSSMVGMLLLTLFLHLKWIKLHWVKGISDLLIANLGLFFIPPCVKIILYFDLFKANFGSIITSVVLSTVLVIYVTAIVYQLLRKKNKDERIS